MNRMDHGAILSGGTEISFRARKGAAQGGVEDGARHGSFMDP